MTLSCRLSFQVSFLGEFLCRTVISSLTHPKRCDIIRDIIGAASVHIALLLFIISMTVVWVLVPTLRNIIRTRRGSTLDLLWITSLVGWSNELRSWTRDTKRWPSEKRTVMADTASRMEGVEWLAWPGKIWYRWSHSIPATSTNCVETDIMESRTLFSVLMIKLTCQSGPFSNIVPLPFGFPWCQSIGKRPRQER